ncbi:MAG: hypothetical protein ACTSYJ_04825 [Candidatus Thorarchaeota archaeon]
MDSSTNDEQIDYESMELKEARSDRYQVVVFLIHVVTAVIISVLSFSDGWLSWFVGTGVVTPVLLCTTGLFYGVLPGKNWYRDEMVPYMSRTFMVQEFETDRFLKFIQTRLYTALITSYFSTILTQIAWFHIATFTIPFLEYAGIFGEFFVYLFFGMFILYCLFLIFWLIVLEPILKSKFSDVSQLIEFSENWQKATKDAKEKSKQK